MQYRSNLLKGFLIICFLSLAACGGGNHLSTPPKNNLGDNSSSNMKPVAAIDGVAVLVEGTATEVTLNGEESNDVDGHIVSYQWQVEDNAGYPEVTLKQVNASSPSVSVSLPLTVSKDAFIEISLIVTDNKGLKSDKATSTIYLAKKLDTFDIDTSSFNGIWYSPCFNNEKGFSARQKITIIDTKLVSEVSTYANAPAKTPDCPENAGVVFTDVDADLSFGAGIKYSDADKADLYDGGAFYSSNTQLITCKNEIASLTDIELQRVQSSGNDTNSIPEMNNTIALVTGSRDDFLPDSTYICITQNGNLLFAGHKYTPGINNKVEDVIDHPLSSLSWKVGIYEYHGGGIFGSQVINRDNSAELIVNTYMYGGSDNGEYTGSSITINHTLKGAGSYSIGEDSAFLLADNNSHKRMTLEVSVGASGIGGESVEHYKASSGEANVIVDSEGKYHFTITTPITLSKVIRSDSRFPPIAGSPETFSFIMNDIRHFALDP